MKENKWKKSEERKNIEVKTCNIDNKIFGNNDENVRIRRTHLKIAKMDNFLRKSISKIS